MDSRRAGEEALLILGGSRCDPQMGGGKLERSLGSMFPT